MDMLVCWDLFSRAVVSDVLWQYHTDKLIPLHTYYMCMHIYLLVISVVSLHLLSMFYIYAYIILNIDIRDIVDICVY